MNIGDKADELVHKLDATGYWDLKEIDLDIEEMLRNHFASEGETIEFVWPGQTKRDDEMPQVGSVVVIRMYSLDEFEIYRLVDGVMPLDEEETTAWA